MLIKPISRSFAPFGLTWINDRQTTSEPPARGDQTELGIARRVVRQVPWRSNAPPVPPRNRGRSRRTAWG